MIERIFEAYPQVRISHVDDQIQVQSPWMEIELEVDRPYSNEEILKELRIYPFSNVVSKPDQQFKVQHPKEYDFSPLEFLNNVLGIRISAELKDYFNTNVWNINARYILEKSALSDDLFDPVSIYCMLRHQKYLEVQGEKEEDSLIDLLKQNETNKARFLNIIVQMLKHNYYVTSQCQNSIRDAQDRLDAPRALVAEFVQEERGHDLILAKAVASLGMDPNMLVYYQESILMMKCLKWASSNQNGFTAFCCLLEQFEGSSFDEIDPRADYLKNFKGYEIAAECIQKHHRINVSGEHFSVGMKFLEHYKPVKWNEAYYSIRLFEIMNKLTDRIINRIKHEI
jgi:hypothetical protein